ncbi:MAG TPA: bacillithiol biosynthesis deacetylase BshB1 [Coriobacteriia bacterium]|nr:bacillithiol biosynthesis deacetylase BshB1 [Coriobacteriia bacterium]
MTDVVCVGAHPDDVEIGMGATIARMTRMGLTVAIVDLTDGEPTPAGDPVTRRAEAASAARRLGVAERRILGLENRALFDSVEARTALAEELRELRPRVLFGPYPVDAHPDHVAASRIVDAARFWAKLTKSPMSGEPHYPSRLYRYMAVHLRLVREPSFVMDVSEDLAAKLEALSFYRSQFSAHPKNGRLIASIESTSRMWGGTIGTHAGEPFFSDEPIGINSLESLV